MLFLITIIWGSTFPLVKYVVQFISPDMLVFIRFFLAGLLLLPIFILSRRRFDKYALIFGIILGIVNSGSFIFQTYALEITNASRVAFLTSLNIIIVPFIAPLFGLRLPKIIDLVAALIAILGVYILSDADFQHFNIGDIYVILSALCIAIGIILVDLASLKTTEYKLFTFYQIIVTAIIPFYMMSKTKALPDFSLISVWGIILYCAIFATVVAFILQVKYQKYVTANKAALILSLETLFGVLFAYLWGEQLTLNVIIGGVILFIGVICTDVYKLSLYYLRRH